jgi:hypothetical protein
MAIGVSAESRAAEFHDGRIFGEREASLFEKASGWKSSQWSS